MSAAAFALFDVDVENVLQPLHPNHRLAALLGHACIFSKVSFNQIARGGLKDLGALPAL